MRKAAPSRSSRRPPPDAHAPGGPPPLPTRHVEERPDNFIARAKQKQQVCSRAMNLCVCVHRSKVFALRFICGHVLS